MRCHNDFRYKTEIDLRADLAGDNRIAILDQGIYMRVFISSTNEDLLDYRNAAKEAVIGADMLLEMQEYWSSERRPPLKVCLEQVEKADIVVVIVAHRYGWVPDDQPGDDRKSITWLECEAAEKSGKELLAFIVDENYDWPDELREEYQLSKVMGTDDATPELFKTINENVKRLEAFKSWLCEGVRQEFTNCEDLRGKIESALRDRVLQKSVPQADAIPSPLPLHAVPNYTCSHQFIGRKAQLKSMSEWAQSTDPRPVLLFEAIGGTGKSMLTWEWMNNHTTKIREDWAGRFWYSFYEKGASMTDFCCHALAYSTGQQLENFREMEMIDLSELLLRELHSRPWLFILDGLERVLVSYHSIHSAELSDEEAGTTDPIANRDPTTCINPDDDELLHKLAGATPSKLLITSRLVPTALLNKSKQLLPGVRKEILPGLHPPEEAEEMLCSCDITGDSRAIQNYLKDHCDCHPLVIGALAGLINDYDLAPGNFDAWAADPKEGGKFDLADLDLVQKKNHILEYAIDAVSKDDCKLLYTLSLLSDAVDFQILCALKPPLPRELTKVETPKPPEENHKIWELMSAEQQERANQDYQAALSHYGEYKQSLKNWKQSDEVSAPKKLGITTKDLVARGLLQFDKQGNRYNLHPVVRSVVVKKLEGNPEQMEQSGQQALEVVRNAVVKKLKDNAEKMEQSGQRRVDYFTQKHHIRYANAEIIDDLQDGLEKVRIRLKMGKYAEAYKTYVYGLSDALCFNLEQYAKELALLRGFFPDGWVTLPDESMTEQSRFNLANNAAWSLSENGEWTEALDARVGVLRAAINMHNSYWIEINLRNIAKCCSALNKLALQDRCLLRVFKLIKMREDKEYLNRDTFAALLIRFGHLAVIGQWEEAENTWEKLDSMGRNWVRTTHRPGDAEFKYAQLRFWRGDLTEQHLALAEQLASADKNRPTVREIYKLRGEWQLEQGQWDVADATLKKAVRMAREVERKDAKVEAQFLLAKFHLNQLTTPRDAIEQIANVSEPAHHAIAELWYAVGDTEQAKKYGLSAYKWAWADGEPFVHRYELEKTSTLLKKIGTDLPNLSPYDSDNDAILPWEKEVDIAIEKLQAEREIAIKKMRYERLRQSAERLRQSIAELEQTLSPQMRSGEAPIVKKTKRDLVSLYHNLWTAEADGEHPKEALSTMKKARAFLKEWAEAERDPYDLYDLSCTCIFISKLLTKEGFDAADEQIPMPDELMEEAVERIVEAVEAGWVEAGPDNLNHLQTDKDLHPIRNHPKYITMIDRFANGSA